MIFKINKRLASNRTVNIIELNLLKVWLLAWVKLTDRAMSASVLELAPALKRNNAY
jgi:hypothetical protein